MKRTALLLSFIFLFATCASAQAISESSPSLFSSTMAADVPAPADQPLFAMAPARTGNPGASLGAISNGPGAAAQQSPIFGVFQDYNWEATVGYTFFRFYAVPGKTITMNGVNLGLAYYPHGKWIGPEGQLIGTWGSVYGYTARFGVATGGVRFRFALPRGLELWAHGLIGGAHFLPQTAYGGQSTVAYDLGGGVDFGPSHSHFGGRVQADMVGTHFFSTNQYSPAISGGFVFKF